MIYSFDFSIDLNNDRWLLLGEEHLKGLVTIIRDVKFKDAGEYKKWMKKWSADICTSLRI